MSGVDEFDAGCVLLQQITAGSGVFMPPRPAPPARPPEIVVLLVCAGRRFPPPPILGLIWKSVTGAAAVVGWGWVLSFCLAVSSPSVEVVWA